MRSADYNDEVLSEGRRPTKRLLIVLFAAILLVTLPVLPLSFSTVHRLQVGDLVQSVHSAWLKMVSPLKTDKTVPLVQTSLSTQGVRYLSQAADQLKGQIAETPNDVQLHNRLAIIYSELGESDAAIKEFEQVVALCRQQSSDLIARDLKSTKGKEQKISSDTLIALSDLQIELSAAHSNLARLWDILGQHDRVVSQFDQLNQDFASIFQMPKGKMQIAAFGQTNSASKPADDSPNSMASPALAHGDVLMRSKRINEAIREYQNAITLDPHLVAAHQGLGLAAALINNFPLAIKELEFAIQLDPNNSNTHNNLGLAYLNSGCPGSSEQAREHFETAFRLNSANMDAAMNLANILASQNSLDGAAQVLDQALFRNPRCAVAQNNLGTILSLSGKSREAIPHFESALSLQPNMASAHYGLGLALYDLKSYAASVHEFKLALALNPTLVDAQNKIELANRRLGYTSATGLGVN